MMRRSYVCLYFLEIITIIYIYKLDNSLKKSFEFDYYQKVDTLSNLTF